MLDIIFNTFLASLIVFLVGGMLYAFYWFLKYMLNEVSKSDD